MMINFKNIKNYKKINSFGEVKSKKMQNTATDHDP